MRIGILYQAVKAKEETEEQSTIEQIRLAIIAALANNDRNIDEEILENDLTGYGFEISNKDEESNYTITNGERTYEISDDGDIAEVVTEVPTEEVSIKTKFIDSQSGNKVAVIPEGFKVSSVDREQQIDKGLVVIAADGSEFVWIPVEDVTDMYEEKQIDGKTKKVGKLYDFTDDGYSQSTYSSSGYREPDILTHTVWGDASTTAGRGLNLLSSIVKIPGTVGTDNEEMLITWKMQLQNEFDEMIDSVEQNGGFYVGRYETSLFNGVVQSIKGATSAIAVSSSANTWYGLYQKEKEYSEKNSLTSVIGSTMIWGSQYDQMLIWMQGNGINVNSKTPETKEYPDGTSRNQNRTTGTHEADKLNNIYDILGNSTEWTLEANDTLFRVARRRQLPQQRQCSTSLPRS